MDNENQQQKYTIARNVEPSGSVYPQVPEHQPSNLEPKIEPSKPSLPVNKVGVLGLLFRVVFLLLIALGTGLIAGKYIEADSSSLGLAIGTLTVTPIAIGFQLLSFGIARAAFKVWYVYPFLGVFGAGMSETNRHVLQLFTSEKIAIGLQLFLTYMVVFTIIEAVFLLQKKQKPAPSVLITMMTVWLVIFVGSILTVSYVRKGLLIAVPASEGFENATKCLDICSNRNDPYKRSYSTNYKTVEKSFSAQVALTALRYSDTHSAAGKCNVISYIPNSAKRYDPDKPYAGIDMFKATTTHTGLSSSPNGTLTRAGEEPKSNTYEATWYYYCFVQGLHRYEIQANVEFDIGIFMNSLQRSELPSSYKQFYGI